MSEIDNYEMVSVYRMTDAARDELLAVNRECVFNWTTQEGYPMGVIMSYIWKDGRVWLTFAAHRHRAEAIRRNNKVSVAVSGVAGMTPDCPRGTATMKGRAYFHDDQATKDWFYPALAAKVTRGDPQGQKAFESLLDSPLRTILEIVPEKWITYDADKAGRDMAGQLPEEEKTPRLSGDTVRMNAERAKRGLPPR